MKIFLALISLSTTSILCQDSFRQSRSFSKFAHFPATNQIELDRPSGRQLPAGRRPPIGRQSLRTVERTHESPPQVSTSRQLTIGIGQPDRSPEINFRRAPTESTAPVPPVEELDFNLGETVTRFQLFKRNKIKSMESIRNSEVLTQVRTSKSQKVKHQPRKQNVVDNRQQFRTKEVSQQTQKFQRGNQEQQFPSNNPIQESQKKPTRFANIVEKFFSKSSPAQETQELQINSDSHQTQTFSINNPVQQTQKFQKNIHNEQAQHFSRHTPTKQTQEFSRNIPTQQAPQFSRNIPTQQAPQFSRNNNIQQTNQLTNNIPPHFTLHQINVNDQSPSSPLLLASFSDFKKLLNSV